MIEEMLFTNPLSLLAIKDKQVMDNINNLVPYSTGFEIECDRSSTYLEKNFTSIPDIVNVSNGWGEYRFRIPNGIRGIICLHNICFQLKTNLLLNPLSSIHYHIDCTDCFTDICKLIKNTPSYIKYILSELDTWLGDDTANGREIGRWFKLNDLQTIEYRLGEMTFDYKIILKRIIHCNTITRYFKDILKDKGTEVATPLFTMPDIERIKGYLLTRNTNGQYVKNFDKELEDIQKKLAELEATPILGQEQIQVRKRKHIL